MVYLAIVPEKRDIVHHGLDTQDETELVVHFDGDGSHLVLEAPAEPALVEAIPHLALVIATQLAAEEGGNICGFDPQSV